MLICYNNILSKYKLTIVAIAIYFIAYTQMGGWWVVIIDLVVCLSTYIMSLNVVYIKIKYSHYDTTVVFYHVFLHDGTQLHIGTHINRCS